MRFGKVMSCMVRMYWLMANQKSYLIAIIDDHSRLIVHAEFYLAETRANFLDTLRQAVLARGLPSKFISITAPALKPCI